jgi:hypothetical protein
MAAIHKFSSHVIDYAERLSLMADAAQGKGRHRGRATRWLLLPASGAALYAIVRSDSFSRQAKEVMDEAKSKATELPDDLVARVRQTNARSSSSSSSSGSSSTPRRSTGTRSPASGSRRRSTTRRTTTARSS